MITFKPDFGNKKVFKKISGLNDATRRSIRQAWFDLGRDLKSEANKEILRRPKSGRTYVIRTPSGRRRRHVASKPGETHANLTGTLRRSLSWKTHGVDTLEFGYGIATSSKNESPVYAGAIEFGRKDGSIEARLSLLNAITATQRNAEKYFEMAMKREMR